jgi:L-threonylcarbamoyladenylate synthase
MGLEGPEVSLGDGTVDLELSVLFDTPENYARGLFHALRTFERLGADIIAARLPDTDRGMGRAVRDRLERAASRSHENP